MSGGSNIEWTEATWNPVVGCTPVSPGCLNCYAATMARRLEAMGRAEYAPRPPTVDEVAARHAAGVSTPPSIDKSVRIAEVRGGRAVFTGEVRTLPDRLAEPLKWKKSRRVFVNSMSDLFWGTDRDLEVARRNGVPDPKPVPFEFVDRVFAVMALCPQHTFQVLTKRPERMAEYLETCGDEGRDWVVRCLQEHGERSAVARLDTRDGAEVYGRFNAWARTREDVCGGRVPWPLRSVWLGTSVEDQARADERIPQLLKCPAMVRFISAEPLLGEVDLSRALRFWIPDREGTGGNYYRRSPYPGDTRRGVDWVIVGGESGGHARAMDVAWARSIVAQCREAGVPVFVKQLGARVHCRNDEVGDWIDEQKGAMSLDDICTEGVRMQGDPVRVRLRDRKGGDPSEWPEDLRVREWPGQGLQGRHAPAGAEA